MRSQRGSGNVVVRGEAPGLHAYPPIRTVSDLCARTNSASPSRRRPRRWPRSAAKPRGPRRPRAHARARGDALDTRRLSPARRPQLRVPSRGGARDAQPVLPEDGRDDPELHRRRAPRPHDVRRRGPARTRAPHPRRARRDLRGDPPPGAGARRSRKWSATSPPRATSCSSDRRSRAGRTDRARVAVRKSDHPVSGAAGGAAQPKEDRT